MTAYLDASVLVPMFNPDVHWTSVEGWLARGRPIVFSLWGIAETTSALSHQVRLGRLNSGTRQSAEAKMEAWLALRPRGVAPEPADFDAARRLMLKHIALRAGDALHLAIAQRLKLAMATFDSRLADAARAEGMEIVEFGTP